MVLIDNTFNFSGGMGDSRTAQRRFVILHDTGNPNNNGSNSAYNEASFMYRNWQNANTTYIVGWDRAYKLSDPGYVSWGAGDANVFAPVQLELAHYADRVKAVQAYRNWVELARQSAKDFGIPLSLDQGGAATAGIKTHKWVSDNIWGDHQDPYGYLAELGISKQQLANDIAFGFDSVAQSPIADPNVIKIDTQGHGGVNLINSKGQYLNKFLANGTRWKVAGSAVINGEEMALVGLNQFVPIRYTDWRGTVVRVIHKDGGVNLLNSKGQYLNKYIKFGTRWKQFGVKLINGKVMYHLGGDQWVPKMYVHLEN